MPHLEGAFQLASSPSTETVSFQESLADFRLEFDLWLPRFLRTRLEPVLRLHPDLSSFLESLLEFAARSGKRLRPFLVYSGFRSVAGAHVVGTAEGVLPLAAAAEMLHVFALAHDDVMDQSELRRGMPTLHCAWARQHEAQSWRGDPNQFGASVAILLGDLALVLADACLEETAVLDRYVRAARSVWQTMREEVIEGQILDVAASQLGTPASEDQIRTILSLKSGKYTMERPLHLGASAAGANAGLLEVFTRFGVPLGQAFQIQDDILDLFGDPQITGKPAAADLKEGKSTLLVSHAYENSSVQDRQTLMDAWGNPQATVPQVVAAREVIERSGALDYACSQAQAFADEARSVISVAPVPEESRAILLGLTSFVLDRQT
ncbi:MAG: polyprenyl synthetase family protein [Armatimonadetes bacterium]|nr:polyprenyl synthetase family protein [Armatimonadota bacterium]